MIPIVLVLEKELGMSVTSMKDFSIPCPFHHDSNPSLRVYLSSDEGLGSYYCFGCGKFGNGLNFIHDYKGLSWADTFDYVRTVYEIPIDKIEYHRRDNGLMDCLSLLHAEFYQSRYRLKALEVSIKRYLSGDKKPLENCIVKSFEMRGSI